MHRILKQLEVLLPERSPLADEIRETALPLMYEHCRRRLLCRDESRNLVGSPVPWLGRLSEEFLPEYKLSQEETNYEEKILDKESITIIIDPDGDGVLRFCVLFRMRPITARSPTSADGQQWQGVNAGNSRVVIGR